MRRVSKPGRSRSSASRIFSATAWCGVRNAASAVRISSRKWRGWTKARWSSMPNMVSAALSACGQSRQRVRRAPAWNCIMPTMQSCSCRLKTSIFFPVTAPMRRKPRLTSWVAAHGRCARPSSRSACSTWPTSLSALQPRVWCATRRRLSHRTGFTTSLPPVSPMTRPRTS
ncbi:hypothetical protein D3C86_1253110 [compost metagenome]